MRWRGCLPWCASWATVRGMRRIMWRHLGEVDAGAIRSHTGCTASRLRFGVVIHHMLAGVVDLAQMGADKRGRYYLPRFF